MANKKILINNFGAASGNQNVPTAQEP